MYNIVIQNFYILYSIYSYYKILAIFSVLYNISLQLIYYIHSSLYFLIPPPILLLPPSLPTLVTTSLFLISVTLFLFCYIHLFIFQIPHISDNKQYLSFSVWLISPSIIPSRSIHIVANGKILFYIFKRN